MSYPTEHLTILVAAPKRDQAEAVLAALGLGEGNLQPLESNGKVTHYSASFAGLTPERCERIEAAIQGIAHESHRRGMGHGPSEQAWLTGKGLARGGKP